MHLSRYSSCGVYFFFALVLYVSATNQASGVQPKLSTSKLSASILQPIIAAIYRDRSGFLWIGTQEGLYKFDGANPTIFSTDAKDKNWIPASDIRGISEDAKGNLLIATHGGGVLKWDESSGGFVPIRSFHSNIDYVVRLYISSLGNVWLATNDKIVLFDSENYRESSMLTNRLVFNHLGRPNSLVESKSGFLFVGSDVGLTRISATSNSAIRYDLTSLEIGEKFGVTALELDDFGNLIIGTDTGHIAVINMDSGKIVGKTKIGGLSSLLISDFVLLKELLVIATDKGLFLSDRYLNTIENVSLQGAGLSNNDIYSLYKDDEQVWVGTYNGLDLLSLAPFELFNYKNSGINNDVLSFVQDALDRIWIGTYDGLYLYHAVSESHSRFEIFFNSRKLKDQRITALTVTKKKLWVGYFQGGIQTIDIETGQISTPNIADADEMFVMDLSADPEGANVWIATFNYGLIRITREKSYYYKHSNILDETGIAKLFDSDGRLLLISTSNKVYEYDPKTDQFTWLKFDFGQGLGKTVVLSVAEGKNGDLWFGTKSHGIFRWTYSDQQTRKFEVTNFGVEISDVRASTIYDIEIDTTGNLWCSTQSGIVKLSPEGKLIKRFTTADGLQGNDFTLGASFKSRQGLIYFGGTNGYNRFNPEEIEIDSTPSPMRLTNISLPTQDKRNIGDASNLQSLQLTHRDRFVTFQFSVLDFIDPDSNQFRFMLENFDSNWVDNGTSNTATYAALPAGNYVFRVQGANSAGIWNLEGIALNVTVLPAPWRTWWAYSLYALTLLGLSWGIQRIYRSYAIERRSAELAVEMFETESKADDDMQEQLELQDELVRSAHQHNQTTLSLVSDSIKLRSNCESGDKNRSLAEDTIERIAALHGLEDCLSYQAGGAVANLYQYTEAILPGLIKNSGISSETIITINEVTTLPIPAELASPISIVIYELLENCIQHAFEPGSPANYIHVKLIPGLSQDPGAHCYELSVRDSGIGLSDSIENLALRGRGIAIVQFVAIKLGASLQSTHEGGTSICLIIPGMEDI